MPLLVLMFMAFSSQQIIGDKEMMNSSGQLQSENKPGMMPVDKDKVKMTSGYGMRMHPVYKREMMHTGVDFAAPLGTPVMATADGIVMEIADEVYDPKRYGKFIIITHGQTYKTMYAQLSEVLVKEKQSVKKGEMIGKIGESGLSTAPHLHYEVWKNNEKVNPADYFQ
jgi:murein DD-endopeptidase MepM/ murein hydrolase activator NlpD